MATIAWRKLKWQRPVRSVGLLVAVLLSVTCAYAQDGSLCDAHIAAADSAYVSGEFRRAIQHVDDCLRLGTPTEGETVAGYRLLILAYLRMERLGDAQAGALQLLREVPSYRPDAVADPPVYVALVETVIEQFDSAAPPRDQSWLAANSRWLIGGGVALTGGLLALLLMDGGGVTGGAVLPPPPQLPQ